MVMGHGTWVHYLKLQVSPIYMSVLRYPGGKTRAVKHILPFIPDDCTVLYSPFFGGGSIELTCAKRESIQTIVANDKFELLINFWRCVQTNSDELITSLENTRTSMTKETFTQYRNIIESTSDNIEKAKMYFAINRCSFSGSTFSGGFSNEASKKRFTKSSIQKINTLKQSIAKCDFSSLDVSTFLDEKVVNLPGHYIYADPPYLLSAGSNKLYGNNGNLHDNFDHVALQRKLDRLDRWILSYNDIPIIREMYKNYKIIPLTWKYGMNHSKLSSEILILSNEVARKSDVVLELESEAAGVLEAAGVESDY